MQQHSTIEHTLGEGNGTLGEGNGLHNTDAAFLDK